MATGMLSIINHPSTKIIIIGTATDKMQDSVINNNYLNSVEASRQFHNHLCAWRFDLKDCWCGCWTDPS